MPKFKILLETLHTTHLLKLLDKMYEYEMDPTRTVGATKQTRDAERTDGRTDRRTDGQMDWQSETNIPPNNFVVCGVKWHIIVARLSKSLATLTLGSSKINQHCWRFRGSGVIAAPQIIGLISFCTGMHHEYFFEVTNVLSCSPFMFENIKNK